MNFAERLASAASTAVSRGPEPGSPTAAVNSRRALLARLLDGGWPTAREEQWRYANLASLNDVAELAPPSPADSGVRSPEETTLPAPLPGFARLVFVDGVLDAARSTALPPKALPTTAADRDRDFRLLSALFQPDCQSIRLADGARLELLMVASGKGAAYPRLAIELPPGASADLVERHLGGGVAASLAAPVMDLDIGAQATLTHHRLQELSPRSRWFDSLQARLAAGAHWQLRQQLIGAHTARTSLSVDLAGRAAEFTLHALSAANGAQTHDTSVQLLHSAPEGRSSQLFRGIAADRARVALSADVEVQASAPGSAVAQSLKGLMAGGGAEIDLRPRLTIRTDAVQARHGATTGQLDEQLEFYLLSRGLDRDSARAILKWAFLGEALQAISVPELRHAVARGFAERLGTPWLAEAMA